jgi:hypothetical protein
MEMDDPSQEPDLIAIMGVMKLFLLISFPLLAATAGGAAAACARADSTPTAQESPMTQGPMTQGVANLPFARGHQFASLDEYLAYLEATNGAVDRPYWRQVGPGLYQWTVRMPGSPAGRETATREELMRRYGFSR